MLCANKVWMGLALVGLAMWTGCAAGGSQDPTIPDVEVDQDGDPAGPGTEICNGLDDDGDGLVDEAPTGTGLLVSPCATACGPGERLCLGGTLGGCSAPLPDPWGVCPCTDGQIRACATACGSGVETCLAGSFAGCTAPSPGTEECGDLVDNDCDGEVDEDCGTCEPGDKKQCGSSTGDCVAGTRTCRADGTWGTCVGLVGPTEEVCDGSDNDCDGEIDEGLAPDTGEYNDTCQMARRLPDVIEAGAEVTVQGSLYPTGDEDWMWFRAMEGWHDCEPFAGQCYYELEVTLEPPLGVDVEVCLYPSWPADAPACEEVGDPGSSFCTDPGETSMVLSWEGVCMLDDTLDFVVALRERPSSPSSCASYRLSFSMEGPYTVCPEDEYPTY